MIVEFQSDWQTKKHLYTWKGKVVPRGRDEHQNCLNVSGFLWTNETQRLYMILIRSSQRPRSPVITYSEKRKHESSLQHCKGNSQLRMSFSFSKPCPNFPHHWNSSLRWTCSPFQQIHLAAQFYIQLLQGKFQATCVEKGKKCPPKKHQKAKNKQNK